MDYIKRGHNHFKDLQMKKFAWILGLIMLASATPAFAQNKENLKQIEDYLNNIKTMQASFVQTASNGNTAEGMLYIAKPNKIRMEYNEPTNVLIIGDGDYIIYNDKDLDQVTNIDYDDIPASLILANDVKLDGKKFKVTDYYQDAGITTVTIEYQDKSEIGPITLTFNNNPFELKQWSIVDPQSVQVTVSLYGVQKDPALDSGLFKFKKSKSPLNYKGRK